MITAKTKGTMKTEEGIEEECRGIDPFIVTGPTGTDEEGNEYIYDCGSVTFDANADYWEKFGNTVWKMEELFDECTMNDLVVEERNLVPNQYTIYIDDFGVSKPCEEENVRVPYAFLNGTSMSTPFATAAVGTLSNIYGNDTALQLKDRLLSCIRKSENLNGKVATGGVLDLSKATTHTTGITLDKTSVELTVGDTLQLTPTVIPDNATNKNIIWTSSNEDVATVENGKITTLTEGNTTIEATTEDGNFKAKCEVAVNNVILESLQISFHEYSEIIKDKNRYLNNIAPDTTINDMIKKIETNGTITVYRDDKKITDDKTKISTGMKMIIALNNEHCEFTIVVKGDTNGDGESNLKDLLQINKHRLNKTVLTQEYLLAGDVNQDNEVNLKDLLQINKFRLGKNNIL